MTQKITRFNLKEIQKIRIKCLKCSSVIEIDADKENRVIKFFCPLCGANLFEEQSDAKFIYDLNDLFDNLKKIKNISVEMEFEEKG